MRFLCIGLVGCSSAPNAPQPRQLPAITSPSAGRVVWQYALGKAAHPLSVVSQPGVVTVAASNGAVAALQSDSGKPLWRLDLGEPLGAAVGAQGPHTAVVTAHGDVVVIQQGAILWRRSLGIQVRTAPLVAGERVFVQASDRSVHAFDAQDGRKLWTLPRSGDSLTLLQAGVLRPVGNTLVVGQGPRMLGLNSLTGAVIWEASLAAPRGINEIERLADLVGPAARVGDWVCARSFQLAVGCVDATRGALVWSKNLTGTMGLAADTQQLYATDANDRIYTWNTSTGLPLWSSDALLNHGLTAPALLGNKLVFGAKSGVVHFFDREDGKPLLRMSTDGSPIMTTPVVHGPDIFVLTLKGTFFALRLE